MHGLENSENDSRNLPKLSEIFRNLRKSSEVAFFSPTGWLRVGQENFSIVPNHHSFHNYFISQNAWAGKFEEIPQLVAQKSRQTLFLEAKSLIFLDFIDPARAPKSHLVGATKKSPPYGTFKISSWTRKSALEIAAQMQLQRFYFKHEE